MPGGKITTTRARTPLSNRTPEEFKTDDENCEFNNRDVA
jgi:hypothetical protein